MSDILSKLSASIGYHTDRVLPDALLISKNAYEKTRRFGELLDEKAGSSYEWYTFPLAIKNSEYIIRDVIFPKKQTISHAHVGVSGHDVALASGEVTQLNKQNNTNFYVIGWVHSHADFSPFHSGTDTQNIMDVLNSVSLNTEFVNYKDFNLITSAQQKEYSDSKLIIKGLEAEDGMINVNYDAGLITEIIKKSGLEKDQDKLEQLIKDVLKLGDVKLKHPVITGFCYSMVVNNIRWPPDTLMAVIEEDMLTGKSFKYTNKIPLKIVEVANDIAFTDDDLNKIIDERIDIPKSYSFFGSLFGTDKDEKDKEKDKDKDKKGKKEDSEWVPVDKKGKTLDVTVEKVDTVRKISDDELITEFCDTVWKDAYEQIGSAYYKMDVIIATILVNKNIESVVDIDDEEFRKTGYTHNRFIPSVCLERKEEFKNIMTDYVKKGNTKLLDFMEDYTSEARYAYQRRDRLLKIGSVIDDVKGIQELLNDTKVEVTDKKIEVNDQKVEPDNNKITLVYKAGVQVDEKKVDSKDKKPESNDDKKDKVVI